MAHSDGMTLLEVVLAVMMLSLACAAVMGAVSTLTGMEAYGRKRLAAYEVANRLLLQYLDDDKGMPPKTEPIAYGAHHFFWELDTTPAKMEINRKQESSGANLQALDRWKLVGITVYDADRYENFETRGDEIAFLSRIIDPYAPRNPDTLENFQSPDKIMDWLSPLLRGVSAPTGEGNSRLDGRRLK